MKRSRIIYSLLILAVIPLGLFSRSQTAAVFPFFHIYGGDTLYSVLVFLLLAWCFNKTGTVKLALSALFISYGVEFLQLYQAPWIQNIRATKLGGLILGFGFLWSDIICYTVGMAMCFLGERALLKAGRNRKVVVKQGA